MIVHLNWAQWVLIGVTAFSSIYAIATIGHKREPRSPSEAAISLIFSVAWIWLVIKAGS
jgi:hypothetical protein